MTLQASMTFLLAIVVFAITPGPGVFAILGKALMDGVQSCLSLALGMTISDIVYLILACMGLATIAEHWGGLFTLIRYLGAAYLFYLAYKMWTAPVELVVDSNSQEKKSLHMMGFLQGFLISASNPKVILFYIAFLPSFIDLTALTVNDIAVLSGLTFVGLMCGLMLIAISASAARRQFKSPSAVRKLNRTSGTIMAGAGAFLISKS